MNLEQTLRILKGREAKSYSVSGLDRQLAYLRKLEGRSQTLRGERLPQGIEEFVEGKPCCNPCGEYYLARQTLPFGRPYGKVRIGDVATTDLSPLNLFVPGRNLPQPSSIVFLDTETTGLAGGAGTCAFLIGLGAAEGCTFRLHQLFLRELTEERAALWALAEALEPYEAVVTFNGKSFDIPLLETRYTLARMRSPFTRMIHLDLLHPARRLWKLRLESCQLTRLEEGLLKIRREADVDGSDIPQLYFDYLRTRNARGLQPVFFHNALDIITLAALAAEASGVVSHAREAPPSDGRDLLSLSKLFYHAGVGELALSLGQKAIDHGLPANVEPQALLHLAAQYKKQRRHEVAVELWLEITRRDTRHSIRAFEELAIHYERRHRNLKKALEFTESALNKLRDDPHPYSLLKRLSRRLDRLRKKMLRAAPNSAGAPRLLG